MKTDADYGSRAKLMGVLFRDLNMLEVIGIKEDGMWTAPTCATTTCWRPARTTGA